MQKRVKRFFSNLFETLKRPDMTILPGQLSFFFIMSLVPTITIIFYIATFLNISVSDVTNYLNVSLDNSIVSLLTPTLGNTEVSFGLFVLIVVGIYLASNGTNSIIVTANNIYGIEQKPFFERRVKAIVMIFIIILLFVFILLVPIFGNFLLSLIEKATGYSEIYEILNFVKVPITWLTIFFFIKLLYTIAPDKEIPSKYVNLGALFTSVGWVISTEVYLYYVKHFANYNLYYSGLSNIAILMMWVYILATIFVIGMGINYKEEPYVIERTQKIDELKAQKKSQHKQSKIEKKIKNSREK